MKQSDRKLLTTMARAAVQLAGEFNVQDLANTAWAFGIVKQSDENLFVALVSVVERLVKEFSV